MTDRTSSRDPVSFAAAIRAHAVEMVHRAKASHIGGCLSSADLLAHLYTYFLDIDPRRPTDENRDRFIMSKGHAAAVFYAALAERGFFDPAKLKGYCEDGAVLGGHVSHFGNPGVEASTGSLGHGLPIGCGIALAGKRAHRRFRTVVMMSDGECNAGVVWEAAMFAATQRLSALTAIVDHNKLQGFGRVSDVHDLTPFDAKWRDFGWAVREIDGHDHTVIRKTFSQLPFNPRKPSVIIAHTIKGKGVSFMSNRLEWHYRSPDDEQRDRALEEIWGR
jgi:transketolase